MEFCFRLPSSDSIFYESELGKPHEITTTPFFAVASLSAGEARLPLGSWGFLNSVALITHLWPSVLPHFWGGRGSWFRVFRVTFFRILRDPSSHSNKPSPCSFLLGHIEDTTNEQTFHARNIGFASFKEVEDSFC